MPIQSSADLWFAYAGPKHGCGSGPLTTDAPVAFASEQSTDGDRGGHSTNRAGTKYYEGAPAAAAVVANGVMSPAGGSAAGVPLTLGAGEQLLVILLRGTNTLEPPASSVSWNPTGDLTPAEPLTLIADSINHLQPDHPTGRIWARLFLLTNPTAGSGDLTAAYGEGSDVSRAHYWRLSGVGVPAAASAYTGYGTLAESPIWTHQSGQLVIACSVSLLWGGLEGAGAGTPGAGESDDFAWASGGTNQGTYGSGSRLTSTGKQHRPSRTFASSRYWAMVAVRF